MKSPIKNMAYWKAKNSPAKHKRLLGLVHNLKHSANYWDSDHNKPGEKPKEKKKKDE